MSKKKHNKKVSDKIRLLVREGKPLKQAVAIALSMHGKGNRKQIIFAVMRIRKYQGSGSVKEQIDNMIMAQSGRDMPLIRRLNLGDNVYSALLSDFEANPERRETLVDLGLSLAPKDGESADIMGNRGKIKDSLQYLVDKGVNISDILDQSVDFLAERDDLSWAQKKLKRAAMGAGVTALGFRPS